MVVTILEVIPCVDELTPYSTDAELVSVETADVVVAWLDGEVAEPAVFVVVIEVMLVVSPEDDPLVADGGAG